MCRRSSQQPSRTGVSAGSAPELRQDDEADLNPPKAADSACSATSAFKKNAIFSLCCLVRNDCAGFTDKCRRRLLQERQRERLLPPTRFGDHTPRTSADKLESKEEQKCDQRSEGVAFVERGLPRLLSRECHLLESRQGSWHGWARLSAACWGRQEHCSRLPPYGT